MLAGSCSRGTVCPGGHGWQGHLGGQLAGQGQAGPGGGGLGGAALWEGQDGRQLENLEAGPRNGV